MSFICSGLHLAHGIPHTRDCYPALRRQDATLQETKLPIRKKTFHEDTLEIYEAWWKLQENKENVPPKNDKKEDLECHVTKKEGHNDASHEHNH